MRKRIDRLEQTLFGCQRKLERARDRRLRIQRLLEMGENDHPLFRGFIGKLEGWHPSLDKARHPNVEEARAYKSTRDPGMRYRIVKEILTRKVVG
jgi:hypothetical protein